MIRPLSIAAVLAALAAAPAARAQAPNFQPVRVDTTFLVAYGSGDVAAFGAGAAIEPKYNLTDQLSLGFRLEGVAMYQGDLPTSAAGEPDVSIGLRALAGYYAKADFYPLPGPVRPFVGIGVGVVRSGTSATSTTSAGASVRAEATSAFGFAPQVGLNLGGFRLAATYHWIRGEESIVVVTTVGTPVEQKLPRDFWTFEIGGTFGGGPLGE